MGVSANISIGPYAEFDVPPGRSKEFPPRDEGGNRLFGETLRRDWGLEDRHEDCYRYTPPEEIAGPGRVVAVSGKMAFLENQDLTDLDRRAEMDWFESTFAEQLKALAERYGAPPKVRGGVVFWVS